ncbi:MAG: alpha-ketoacid dehydrogenase subunit beta [Xanthobacteraceae bacterium]
MSLSARPERAPRVFFREAISRAIGEEMERDPRMILLGQDVGRYGGAYGEFRGLYERFGPERIRDTPVAEAATVGIGVGAAASGTRSIVSITYMDFLMLGLDPLINYAAKARYKTGGQLTVPIVVKTTAGAKGQGVAHSQCIEAWLMAVPGLQVVAPSTPEDAYVLMKGALRADGPVVYIDHKRLFPTAGQIGAEYGPNAIGKARITRRGRDVTVVSHSYMARVAFDAAEQLAREGIDCEVIDLRSLAPLDAPTVCASVAETRTLLTLEEGQTTCGVGAEVAFRVQQEIHGVRVARCGALPAPVSSNPVLEQACLPSVARVVSEIRKLKQG